MIDMFEYKNKKPSADANFSQCSDEVKLDMINEKFHEELDKYYEETMNVLYKFENDFAALKETTYIINNSLISKDVVYNYVLNIFDSFIENRNILSCNDELYAEIRKELFNDIEEYYFKNK